MTRSSTSHQTVISKYILLTLGESSQTSLNIEFGGEVDDTHPDEKTLWAIDSAHIGFVKLSGPIDRHHLRFESLESTACIAIVLSVDGGVMFGVGAAHTWTDWQMLYYCTSNHSRWKYLVDAHGIPGPFIDVQIGAW